MPPLTRIGALTATLLLGLGVAAPAHAARYVHVDPAYDVQRETCTSSTECTKTVVAKAEGDIRRTAIRHTRDKIVIRTTFRQLSRTADTRIFLSRIVTNEGVRREIAVVFEPSARYGVTVAMRPNGELVRCAVGYTANYADDVMVLRVPRRCLSYPRWVRAGAGYARLVNEELSYGDDGLVKAGTAERLTLSPRIRRA